MQITIDTESPTPLFSQLVMQIKQAIQSGEVAPGDQLPSIRQLANDLEMNNKTVAKAYRLLERDSVIQARGYRGSFVHPDALTNCTIDLTDWTTKQLSDVISSLRNAGVTDSEIRIAFAAVLNQPKGE